MLPKALTKPAPLIAHQLAQVEEVVFNLLEEHDLQYKRINLELANAIIDIERPEAPLLIFPDGYTVVQQTECSPKLGQVLVGKTLIRWEEETL